MNVYHQAPYTVTDPFKTNEYPVYYVGADHSLRRRLVRAGWEKRTTRELGRRTYMALMHRTPGVYAVTTGGVAYWINEPPRRVTGEPIN